MTYSSNSLQSTRPIGRVLWEELLVLYRFYSYLRVDILSPGIELCIVELTRVDCTSGKHLDYS